MKRHNGIATVAVAAAFLLATAGMAETLLDVDFAKLGAEALHKGKGRFAGGLPRDCVADFPTWNGSIVTSRGLVEDGRAFLRFNVAKLDKSVQFYWPIRPLKVPEYYKLSVVFRAASSELSVGIRQLSKPYEKIWREDIVTEKPFVWSDRTFAFKLERGAATPIGLFLYPGTGDCDLASLKLATCSPEEFYATFKRPEKSAANFFRNSRLPLGLQAGWSLSREFEEGSVGADASEKGPSGHSALKLQSDTAVTLFSEPFQVADPLAPNAVSLAFKGAGKWRLSVGCRDKSPRYREIASKWLIPSSRWKTETIAFTPGAKASDAKGFALSVSGAGTILLDCFSARDGADPKAYRSRGECEVALALPKTEVSDARLQFAHEPAKIDYLVTGDVKGAILRLKVFDVCNHGKELPGVELGKGLSGISADSGREDRGSVGFDVFPDAMLGQFRIEAWAERDGKRISPFNEILVTRIRRPIHFSEDAPASPFGAHFMASPLMIKMMKAAGVNWARLHDAGTEYIGWTYLEPRKGDWRFRDKELERYRKARVKLYAGLQTTPPWASFLPDSNRNASDRPDNYRQPKDLDAWSNYVRTVTSRYKDMIDEYFIWNEPWGESFWHIGYDVGKKVYLRGETPEADYAKISRAAYKAAKEGNPAAKISGFNSTEGEPGRDWTRKVFDNGAFAFCDRVDYHFYASTDQAIPNDQTSNAFKDAIGPIMERIRPFAKPIYMSEGQANTSLDPAKGTGLYNHALCWDSTAENPAKIADRTCRFVIANLAAGCSKVFLYTTHSFGGLVMDVPLPTLIGPDGYPHAELAAFSHLAWLLEDKKFSQRLPLNEDVLAYIFEGKDGAVAAISGRKSGRLTFSRSDAIAFSDLFGNPVQGKIEYQGRMLYASAKGSADHLKAALLAAIVKP